MGLASDLIQRVQIGLKSLPSAVSEQLGEGSEFIRKHPVTSAVTVGGGILAATQVVRIVRKKRKAAAKTKRSVSKKTTRKKRSKRSKRSWQLDRARISKQKHEVAYQKRKKRLARGKSKKRVGKTYYTKKGQPYKILRSGKAKFIKKSKGRKR